MNKKTMNIGANNDLINSAPETDLASAILQAMEKGFCQVGVSSNHGFVMCQFGDNEFYFNQYASNSTSMEEFLEDANREGTYGKNEMAKDIAETIEEMCRTFDPNEGLYYMYLMKENLPEHYHTCLEKYITIAKENPKYENENTLLEK